MSRGDRGPEAAGAPGAVRDGAARPGAARSATSTRSSSSSRPSSCGRGSGRWRAGSRRSPGPDDFVEYEILDQSVIVVRTEDVGVTAFQNACRHRGVKVADGRGTCESGFTCPFHGWCYGPDGTNTFVSQRSTFSEHNLQARRPRPRARCGARRGAAARGSTSTTTRRRCGACIEPFATILDAWQVESMHAEWWYAVPPARELEARRRGVHGAVPRPRGAPAARRSRRGSRRATRRRSTRARSSTPRSTTCTR